MLKLNLQQDITKLSVIERIALYQQAKRLRIDTEHALKPLQTFESNLKDSLISDIPKSGEGVVSSGYLTRVTSKEKPTIKDWPTLWAALVAADRGDLLQKRLAERAVMDIENWKEIPGVEAFNVLDLSITKV